MRMSLPDITFYTPVFLFIGSVAFLLICLIFCKKCNKLREAQQQEPTRNQDIPPPPTAPPVPTAPPMIQGSDPPPYNEVIEKPYFYPAPVGHLPFYDSMTMEDLSRVLHLQDQCSRIISERSSASAASTLGR